jgi:hypothetical protein
MRSSGATVDRSLCSLLPTSEDTGKAILAASDEEVAFVVFGACIPF